MTIQEVGLDIFERHLKPFYVFGGSEYGVKFRYLQMIRDQMQDCKECDTVDSVIQIMKTRHLVPLPETLYIVRYDSSFIQNLSEFYANTIRNCNIIGSIVCIFESEKDVSKCEKFLPDCTVRINSVDSKFIRKYLHADYPKLPDNLINIVSDYSSTYGQAYNVCSAMSNGDITELCSMDTQEILRMFSLEQSCSESDLKQGIASRNFSVCMSIVENYADRDSIFYTILSVMLELEKLILNPRSDSSLKPYASRWKLEDVYNMFMQTYEKLLESRKYSVDVSGAIIHLLTLLQFSSIPSKEEMYV